MKKAILASVLMICITFAAMAQPNHKKQQKPQFTSEQEATLAVKKLTLSLDLSSSQQEKMYPLLLDVISKKKAMMEARKENKGQRPEMSSDEIYAKMVEKLDAQIAFQGKVKAILKKDQFEKWQRIKSKMDAHKEGQHASSKKGNSKGKKGQGNSKGKKAHS